VPTHEQVAEVEPVSGLASLSPEDRKQALVDFYHELQDCQKCPLAATRNTVVFGSGDPHSDLMLVGEAPGFHEDQQGKPFVGQAGKLLDELLAGIDLERSQVFIANVLKCRPPSNRDPQPEEIEACEGHLFKQIALIQPRVICTLGNFATKLLSGRPDGITKVRGTPQVRELGGRSVFLYPIFHPAAALYTPAMNETLRADFGQLPELLEQEPPPIAAEPEPEPEPAAEAEPVGATATAPGGTGEPEPDQLGLF
jgi:uracil-DNA glycosylase